MNEITLEDKHIQLELKRATDEENEYLLPFDLILRTSDEGKSYTSFDIFDNENQKYLATITFEGEAWSYFEGEAT